LSFENIEIGGFLTRAFNNDVLVGLTVHTPFMPWPWAEVLVSRAFPLPFWAVCGL